MELILEKGEVKPTEISWQKAYNLFQKLHGNISNGGNWENITNNVDYKELLMMCTVDDDVVNVTACFAVITLHSNHPSLGQFFSNMTSHMVHARNISGVARCMVHLFIIEKSKNKGNPYVCDEYDCQLFNLVKMRPNIMRNVLSLLEDHTEEEGLFEQMLPFLKKLLCLLGCEEGLKIWQILSKYSSPNELFSMLLWVKIPNVLTFKTMLLESNYILEKHPGAFCLLLASFVSNSCSSAYIPKGLLEFLKNAFFLASSSVQSITIVVLSQAINKCQIFILDDLLLLAEDFVKKENVPSEIIWIFMSALIEYIQHFPSSKEAIFKKMNDFYYLSYIHQSNQVNFGLDVIEESLCCKFPELNDAVLIINLLKDSNRDERVILKWLRQFEMIKPSNSWVRLVIQGLLIGGTKHIKMKCLKLFKHYNCSQMLLIFLIHKEENPVMMFHLFNSFSMCLYNKKEEDFVLKVLEALYEKGLSQLLLLKFHFNVWSFSKNWNKLFEFLLTKKYVDIEEITLQADFIRKVLLEKGSVDLHWRQLTPVLLNIVKRCSLTKKNFLPVSLAFNCFFLLSNVENLQPSYHCDISLPLIVLDVILKKRIWLWTNTKKNERLWVINSVCKCLGLVPEFIMKNNLEDKAIFLSIQIIWNIIIDPDINCFTPYKALKNFSLGHFTKDLLPSSCSGHFNDKENGSDVQIPASCWIHLLKYASNKWLISNVFQFLLKKDLKKTISKKNIPPCSFSLFKGLWQFISNFHSNKKLSDDVLLCLMILSGKYTKGLPIKNFVYLDNILKFGNHQMKHYTVIILIRQGKYNKNSFRTLVSILKQERIEEEYLETLCKMLPSLKETGTIYSNVLEKICQRFDSFNEQKRISYLKDLSKMKHHPRGRYLIKEVISSIWANFEWQNESFSDMFDEVSRFGQTFLEEVWKKSIDEKYLEKISALTLISLRTCDPLPLGPLVFIGLENDSFRNYVLARIQEVVFLIFVNEGGFSSSIAYNWLSFLMTIQTSDPSEDEFVFSVFALSLSVYSGFTYPISVRKSLQMLPYSFHKIFNNYEKKNEFLRLLSFWWKKGTLCSEFIKAITIALIIMYLDDSKSAVKDFIFT